MISSVLRVLVVEDNPQDVLLIRHVLSRYRLAEFQLHFAENTAQCVEQIRLAVPDVVLLDHGLPGEDGLSFLRRLSRMGRMPPVIMLTGLGDESMAIESIRAGAYDYYPKDAISSDTLGRAVHLTVERYRMDIEMQRGNEQVIFAMADAVESKDLVTGGHLHRLGHYAAFLGGHMGLDDHDMMILQYGAILHDIGKISVSDSVLCKPSTLTDAEWIEMRKHPVAGERICTPLRFSEEIGRIIRHHHERWDGTGYVDRLAGQEIPLLARMISVVDTFDAMRSDRPYRRALSLDTAIDELKEGAGSQFDPEVVGSFLEIVRDVGDAVREAQQQREFRGLDLRNAAA
jgi:putative two-component system response regulator